MVVLQILNKVLKTSSMDLILDNNLTREMFTEYENEFDFIYNFYTQYGKVPDRETFLSKFTEFILVDVNETDEYLVNKLNEEYLYYKSVPVIQKMADLLKTNSTDAVDYMIKELPNLVGITKSEGTDIIKKADERLLEYKRKVEGESTQYITTGFEQLDSIFKGFNRGEELVVLFARIGQGKSWILNKMLAHSWELGYNVGLISPEMSATKIGYRFDTLVGHLSNKNLNWRTETIRI